VIAVAHPEPLPLGVRETRRRKVQLDWVSGIESIAHGEQEIDGLPQGGFTLLT
jgi:hypothetical protein